MNYVVMEMKTTSGATTIVTPAPFTTRDSAENRYHTLCATASISSETVDCVVLMREDGIIIERECFKHEGV